MLMSRFNPITNFFRPVNRDQQKKRTFSTDGSEASRECLRRKTPLSSPQDDKHVYDEGVVAQLPLGTSTASLTARSSELSSPPPVSSQQSLPTRTTTASAGVNDTAPFNRSRSEDHKTTIEENSNLTSLLPPTPESTSKDLKTSGIESPSFITSSSPQNKATDSDQSISAPQPVLASSQRIVKNGKVAIINSDDESDCDEESDSDDSLEGLDDILTKIRTESALPSAKINDQSPDLDSEGVRRTRRKPKKPVHFDEASDTPTRHAPIMPKKYKFSLDALARQRKQDEASSAAINRAKSMLETNDQRGASYGPSQRIVDTGVLDSVLKDRGAEDNIGRLKAAIQRTEAFEHDKVWSFFDETREDSEAILEDFPHAEDERLQRLFGKEVARQQSFLSGYAGEFATKGGFPEEIMLWIIDAVCLEPRDDLRYSYVFTLRDAVEQSAPLLTPERIDSLFRKVGANAAALDVETPITPHVSHTKGVGAESRPNLLSLLVLLGSVAGSIASESCIHLLNTLCRLMLDHTVTRDCHVSSAIEEAFASLVELIPEDMVECVLQSIMATAYHTIDDTPLRLQLLQNIPARSSRLILLRQRLALAFFYQDPQLLARDAEALVDLQSISNRLSNPQFTIRSTTDFTELAASFGILGIGIDDGNPPPSPLTKASEKAFNADVDSLASKIKDLFNDIVDTGASHMKKTESKETLEGLQRRLEYAVRTKPKPRKAIFGESEFVPLEQQEFMDKFFKGRERSQSISLPDG